jgi:tetratricopeptide (TPR) repeat protein
MHSAISFRYKLGLIIICLIFFALGLMRINDLTIYTPDSSRYLIFANSLVQGKGFVDNTQPEPDRFVVQAPLYPILLTPVQLIFPYSLEASKIWTLLWGVLAIILFYRWVLRLGSPPIALFTTLLFAFNPLTIVYSSEVLSEAPFLAFLLFALIYFEEKPEIAKKSFLLITSIVAVALLREIGVVFAIASIFFFFIKKEYKHAIKITVAVGIVLGGWYLRNHYFIGKPPESQASNYSLLMQHIVTPPESSIMNELLLRVWLNIEASFLQLSGMLVYPLYLAQQFKLQLLSSGLYSGSVLFFNSVGKFIVAVILLPLIVWGIVLDHKKSKAAFHRILFVLIYLGAIFIYPVSDIRFLLPVLPFILYYVASSLIESRNNSIFFKIVQNKFLLFATITIILAPNIISIYEILKLNMAYRSSPILFYEKYGKKENCPVMFTQPWELLGEWIRKNLPESVVIASPVKNISTVIGNRKMLEVDQGVVQPVFETLLRDNDVTYILSPSRGQDLKIFHFLMLESKRFWFEEIHGVGNLYLYKVHSKNRECEDSLKALSYTSDSTTVNYVVEHGRKQMLQGDYVGARTAFAKALQLDSLHPSLLYQMIVCRTLARDSADAMKYYTTLYKLPQALGFIFQSRLHLQAMEKVLEAEHNTFGMGKGVGLFNAASLYWKLGYPNRAAQIMNNYLAADSSYFVGMLWGFHYNLQTGDTAIAKKYLTILSNIDLKNPVVESFNKIFSLFDSLKLDTSSNHKSSYHVSIGREYKKIELFEESIDEGEKALGLDPNNPNAYLLLAENFEKKNNIRMAEKMYRDIFAIQPANNLVRERLNSLKNISSK